MTLRYYVKGRETISKAAAVVDRAYCISSGQLQEICRTRNLETLEAQGIQAN